MSGGFFGASHKDDSRKTSSASRDITLSEWIRLLKGSSSSAHGDMLLSEWIRLVRAEQEAHGDMLLSEWVRLKSVEQQAHGDMLLSEWIRFLKGPASSAHGNMLLSEWVRLKSVEEQALLEQKPDGLKSWGRHKEVAPDPISPPRKSVRARGPADNAHVFSLLGGTGFVILPVMLRTINLLPFTDEAVKALDLGIDALVLASCLCSLRVKQHNRRMQQVIAEIFAPLLPERLVLSREKANNLIVELLNNDGAIADEPWWVDGITTLRRTDAERVAAWNASTNRWNPDIAFQLKMDMVRSVVAVLNDRYKASVYHAVLLCLLAFALRGQISQAKLMRLQPELEILMPQVAKNLNTADIALTWQNFGHLVDDHNIAGILRRYLKFLPAPAIRLRVWLSEAAGSRLTSLDVIARAIHEHPEFPWHLLMRLYPQEWANAIDASTAVGDNPYYGYRGDISRVRSKRFKSLSWACGRLLIEGGDRSLSYYRGFIEDRMNSNFINTLICKYYTSSDGPDLDNDPTAAEYAGKSEISLLVEAYPANSGTYKMQFHPDPKKPAGDEEDMPDLEGDGQSEGAEGDGQSEGVEGDVNAGNA